MANLINPTEISGGAVYGIKQVEYTVEGESGQDFIAALTVAAFKQSVAIEQAASSYADVVRARQSKVSDLGEALSIFANNIATLKTGKNISNDDWTDWYAGMATAADILNKYNISHNIVVSTNGSGQRVGRIQRRNAQKNQTDIQYEMDKEDNNLQQDLITLNSFISKRDSAYSTASKIIKKAGNAASSTISNIGG